MNVAGTVLRRVPRSRYDRRCFPAAPYSSCSSCTGFLLAVASENPSADVETALASEKFRGVDCLCFQWWCAESNRVVSPDWTPDGYISSAI